MINSENKKEKLKSFGDKVRAHRNIIGLSQEQLAEKAMLHRTYIGMIERGEKNVTLINIHKIAYALNLDIIDLFK
jgi:transcriptional regulator with XRE-family HTH domain